MFDLENHVALVTGGNGGIGLGMARGLARSGASVAIWGRDEAKNAAAVEELSGLGADAHAFRCDVASEEDVVTRMRETIERFGRIDSCFANAGMNEMSPGFAATEIDSWNRVLGVNLTGAFLTFREAARHMIERGGGGKLIATASIGALLGMPKTPHYAAAKAGVCALVRSAAVDLARHDIQANAILPGWVETPMIEPLKAWDKFPQMEKQVLAHTPARRWGSPDDFEGIAVYLASPHSHFQTGAVIRLDGGFTIM